MSNTKRRVRVKVVRPTRYRGRHLQLSVGGVRFESDVDIPTPSRASLDRARVQDALDTLILGHTVR